MPIVMPEVTDQNLTELLIELAFAVWSGRAELIKQIQGKPRPQPAIVGNRRRIKRPQLHRKITAKLVPVWIVVFDQLDRDREGFRCVRVLKQVNWRSTDCTLA